MSPTVEKLTVELTTLEEKTTKIAQELWTRYEQYLKVLRPIAKRQLMSACYYLCTQAFPGAFVELSRSQREELQAKLKELGQDLANRLTLATLLSEEEDDEPADEAGGLVVARISAREMASLASLAEAALEAAQAEDEQENETPDKAGKRSSRRGAPRSEKRRLKPSRDKQVEFDEQQDDAGQRPDEQSGRFILREKEARLLAELLAQHAELSDLEESETDSDADSQVNSQADADTDADTDTDSEAQDTPSDQALDEASEQNGSSAEASESRLTESMLAEFANFQHDDDETDYPQSTQRIEQQSLELIAEAEPELLSMAQPADASIAPQTEAERLVERLDQDESDEDENQGDKSDHPANEPHGTEPPESEQSEASHDVTEQSSTVAIVPEPIASAQSRADITHATPGGIEQWVERLEDEMSDLLQRISQKSTRILTDAHVVSNRIPKAMLASAQSSGTADEVGEIPNILNLVVEMGGSEKSRKGAGRLHIVAVYLRLSELEFHDPVLMVCRNRIREVLRHLQGVSQTYRQRQQELTVAKAEAAWRSTWSSS
ncbi:MAG: hypothetical protein AAGF24_00170 [Cyanobacteria bacterium P01_H01_bin.121]